jgi:hypothetical protein
VLSALHRARFDACSQPFVELRFGRGGELLRFPCWATVSRLQQASQLLTRSPPPAEFAKRDLLAEERAAAAQTRSTPCTMLWRMDGRATLVQL